MTPSRAEKGARAATSARRRCVVELLVPFHDLDPMNVVWHGNYMKYFDVARHALFEQAGIDLYDYGVRRGYLFPVVKTSTKHIGPLRRGDRFTCTAELVESKRKLIIDFEIRLQGGQLCARCRSEQVAVRTSDLVLEIVIPEDVRRALDS
jgi:acyl-CoA thioester hydrolase